MPALSAPPNTLRAAVLRTAIFGSLWWVLVEGMPYAMWLGVLVVGAAVAASLRVWPPSPGLPSPFAAAGFLVYFLWQSLRGGTAVAALALRPRMGLQPHMRQVRLRLPPGPARVLFADTVSLLPGTLSADLEGDTLTVHVLDRRLVSESDLDAAQDRVARLLGGP